MCLGPVLTCRDLSHIWDEANFTGPHKSQRPARGHRFLAANWVSVSSSSGSMRPWPSILTPQLQVLWWKESGPHSEPTVSHSEKQLEPWSTGTLRRRKNESRSKSQLKPDRDELVWPILEPKRYPRLGRFWRPLVIRYHGTHLEVYMSSRARRISIY